MIWIEESKKLIRHPMLWCLLAVFTVLNGISIWSYVGSDRAEIRELHADVVHNTMAKEVISHNMGLYDNLDMVEIKKAKQEMTDYEPKGSFKAFVDSNYEKLNDRVAEIKENKESDQLFYPGYYYPMHATLFAKLFRKILIEMIFLIGISTLFLMDYERICCKTGDLIYASKIGRNIQLKKLLLGVGVGYLYGAALMVITLGMYFFMVPYDGLWNVSVSAELMAVTRYFMFYPLITFHSLTVLQYLLATCGAGSILAVIMGVIVGGIQLLLRNSYYTFVTVLLLFAGGLATAGYFTGTWWDILLSANPSAMIFRTGTWFMEHDLPLCFEGNELLSLAIQGILAAVLLAVGRNRWLKSDC